MHSIAATEPSTESGLSMFPTDGGGYRPHDPVQGTRPLNPRYSIEDYNRVMLEYTKRRMSTFAQVPDGRRHGSTSSDSSESSDSGDSTAGVLARQAAAGHDSKRIYSDEKHV